MRIAWGGVHLTRECDPPKWPLGWHENGQVLGLRPKIATPQKLPLDASRRELSNGTHFVVTTSGTKKKVALFGQWRPKLSRAR